MSGSTTYVRKNFSDRTKADLYAQGKAICAFCGCDLWILRRGVSPSADHDWADHQKPSSRGGGKRVGNGITACSECNYKKSDNGRDKAYFFIDGKPTPEYYFRFDALHPAIAVAIQANRDVHWSDWYFNRALAMLSLSTHGKWDELTEEEPKKRTPTYWAGASFKRVVDWRKHSAREDVPHLESRGLIPNPLEPDQSLALELFECDTVDDVHHLVERLLPHYIGHAAHDALVAWSIEDEEVMDILQEKLGPALNFGEDEWHESTSNLLNEMASNDFAESMMEYGIAVVGGRQVVPVGGEWPSLPKRRMRAFLGPTGLTRSDALLLESSNGG